MIAQAAVPRLAVELPSPSVCAAANRTRTPYPSQLSYEDAYWLMHDPENVRLYDRPFRLMEISYPSRRDRERPTTDSAVHSAVDEGLIDWANSRLPSNLQFTDICDCCGLNLTRIAESIKGTPVSPPVLDSWFPSGPDDGKLDGLFSLFAFLLSNDVRLGNVSINDIRLGEIDKTVLLLVLKLWEDKSTALSVSRG